MSVYPAPIYNPPLPIFNPIYFPQSFDTGTTGGGGGGGGGNIFPSGLSTGGDITYSDLVGANRELNYVSTINLSSVNDSNPLGLTLLGQIQQTDTTLEIGQYPTQSQIVNINCSQFTVNGGSVLTTTGTNTYTNTSTNTFDSSILTSFSTTGFESYSSLAAIPNLTTPISTTNYSFLAVSLNTDPIPTHRLYFYDNSFTPYNSALWNQLALITNETYVNPTLTGSIQIGNSITTDNVTFTSDNFFTVINTGGPNTSTTYLNAGIAPTYSGINNTLIGPSSTTPNIITGGFNTIIGAENNISFDCSLNTICGYNNFILTPAYNSGIFGNQSNIQNQNTTIIGNSSTSTYDNTIHLAQTPYISTGYLRFNPISTFTSITPQNNVYACSTNSNQLYNWDGNYWTQLTQKNCPYGYSNQTGLATANMAVNINMTGTPSPNTLVTFHINCVFNITDTSVSPYETTSIMISGAMVTLDLYSIAVQLNTTTFNSYQSVNTNTGSTYPTGFADIGMIKINQPTLSDWITSYPTYPRINVVNIGYNVVNNRVDCGIQILPAPIASVFPTTIQSACNAVIELKNDTYIPSPYKINLVSNTTNYPT